jgi:hypothetical protein
MSLVDQDGFVQVGTHATALHNLVINTDGAGAATIEQGVIGGAGNRVVMTVDAGGEVTFPSSTEQRLGVDQTISSTAIPVTPATTNVANSSGRPKFISVHIYGSAAATQISLTISGVVVGRGNIATGSSYATLSYPLPDGMTAVITTSGSNFTNGYYTLLE